MHISWTAAAFAVLAIMALPHPAIAAAQTASPAYSAEIRTGTCTSLSPEVVAPLTPVVPTAGTSHGSAGAIPVAQSRTTVPQSLADLLAADHAVVVHPTGDPSGAILACGEIGGVMETDGTLAMGLAGVPGSGVAGMAVFAPIVTGEDSVVTLLLVIPDNTMTTAEPSAARPRHRRHHGGGSTSAAASASASGTTTRTTATADCPGAQDQDADPKASHAACRGSG